MRSIISDKGAIGNQPGTYFSHSLGHLLTDGWVVSHDASQHGLKVAAGEHVCIRGGGIGVFGLVAGGQYGDQVRGLEAGFVLAGEGRHFGSFVALYGLEYTGTGRNGNRFRQEWQPVAGIQQPWRSA